MPKTLKIMTDNNLTLNDIHNYALDQMESPDNEDLIGFMHDGHFIINPWMEPTGRFDLTTKESINTYGKPNFIYFCETVSERLVDLPSPSDGKVIGTITAWGEDDYSIEWMDLPSHVQDYVTMYIERYCGSSSRGSRESIIEELRSAL